MKKILFVILLVFQANSMLLAEDKLEDITFDVTKHIEIYNRVLKELELNYVDSLDYNTMLQFSLDNMLYSLDPYTVYIPEQEEDNLRRMRSGEYGGIGSIVSQIDGNVYIYSPYKGMAAQKNDILAGDIILSVDGKSAKDMSVSEVSDLLRGTPGSIIRLKLMRNGNKITRKFKREIIKIDPIPYFGMLDNEVAYIVFNDFIDESFVEFKKILNELVSKHGAKKLIIDLRNNGGGLIDQSVKIASIFVPKSTEIVSVKGNSDKEIVKHITNTDPLYPDMKVAFLIGENTASAAEILSGAMQDTEKALVFGDRSFGKGLVQGIRRLPYNSYLKVTTAKYYLPSERCIQAINYDDRRNYGRDRNIPDSLTSEYYTKAGRLVRDASGITPDVKIKKADEKLNISYYLYSKNLYFLFANNYVAEHAEICPPDSFSLTEKDFEDFKLFIKEKNFSYKLVSEDGLNDLRKLVKYEGLDVISDSLFDELTSILKPNIERDVELFKNEITAFLEKEIVKRYYYQSGEIQYSINGDEELKIVLDYIHDDKKWNELYDVKRVGEISVNVEE